MTRAVAQCLVLAVSLGWGVVAGGHSLGGRVRCDIILLGLAHFVVGAAFGLSPIRDAENPQPERPRAFEGARTIATKAAMGLNYEEGGISLIFIVWTAVALAGTGEPTKRARYKGTGA